MACRLTDMIDWLIRLLEAIALACHELRRVTNSHPKKNMTFLLPVSTLVWFRHRMAMSKLVSLVSIVVETFPPISSIKSIDWKSTVEKSAKRSEFGRRPAPFDSRSVGGRWRNVRRHQWKQQFAADDELKRQFFVISHRVERHAETSITSSGVVSHAADWNSISDKHPRQMFGDVAQWNRVVLVLYQCRSAWQMGQKQHDFVLLIQDLFFYQLVYDPNQKTLNADRGEIRVGGKYQADAHIQPVVTEGANESREREKN